MPEPSRRLLATLTFVPQKEGCILFGGNDITGVQNDLWLFKAGAWQGPLVSVNEPPARIAPHACYDSARGALLIYGGYIHQDPPETDVILNDIWLWKNGTWSEGQSGATRPPGRISASIAFDEQRGRLVLFGGTIPNGPNEDQDTWEWDGTAWHRFSPSSADDAPSARSQAAMAYDASRGRVVLYGGEPFGDFFSSYETWEWNGSTWTKFSPEVVPECFSPRLVYDSVRKRLVLFDTTRTWEWDGVNWTEFNYSGRLPFNPGATYDPLRKRLVTFGGRIIEPGGTRAEGVWERIETSWSGPPIVAESSPRYIQAIVEARHDGSLVALGADTPYSLANGLWLYDGAVWSGPIAVASGFRVSKPAISYDSGRREVVFSGGWTEGSSPNTPGLSDQLWRFNGSAMSGPSSQRPGPGARAEHQLVHLDDRAQTLLFGGFTVRDSGGGVVEVTDSWIHAGEQWLQPTAGTPVSAELPYVAVYDSARKCAVMFNKTGTWEYGADGWAQRHPQNAPTDVRAVGAAYDAKRARVVMVCYSTLPEPGQELGRPRPLSLHRGADNTGWTTLESAGRVLAFSETTVEQTLPERTRRLMEKAYTVAPRGSRTVYQTWEWDGNDWLKVEPSAEATPSSTFFSLAYSSRREKVMYFGRDRHGWAFRETWEWSGSAWDRVS